MDHRMRLILAPLLLLLVSPSTLAFIPGADGPVSRQEGLEGGSTTLFCDTSTATPDDQLTVLVWYKHNAPIYSFDAISATDWFNDSARMTVDRKHQLTALKIEDLTDEDQGLYHCRVDFILSPTRNLGVNLTIVVLPVEPYLVDEVNEKVVGKVGPYFEGDTLILRCLVVGGRPAPRLTWYSSGVLVDESDGPYEVPGMRENVLYLPLTRDNAGDLTCRVTNTNLTQPFAATVEVDLYLSAYNVSIHWLEGADDQNTLQAGRPALVQCKAHGAYPAPKLAWWLDHRHLTKHSNQSWINATKTAVSHLEITPKVTDDGATLSCIATNEAMDPERASKADVITLNVTYSPIVEVSKIGNGKINEVVELDALHLDCEIKANPVVDKIEWYFNDSKITPGGRWGNKTSSSSLLVEEATREHSGRYSCAAGNAVGETRAHHISITVLYPPECSRKGITLSQETITCNIKALPPPDTYFWHIAPSGFETQHLTTGSALLPLAQISGPLSGPLYVTCEAGNGIASQEKACQRALSLDHLRPRQPQQCDLAFEYQEFQMRCIPVENATHYEVSVWRISTSNTSLLLAYQGSMGFGGEALAHGSGTPLLVRGALGTLKMGDEAGAAACNRYGCSRALLLRPTDTLFPPPWWHFFLEKDVGISLGAVVLLAVFLMSTYIVVKLARRSRSKTPAQVVQVLQLDDVAREYLDALEHKRHAACSVRSCSSGYSDGSLDLEPPGTSGLLGRPGSSAHLGPPAVDRQRKPLYYWDPGPPPDVTITQHRESAV